MVEQGQPPRNRGWCGDLPSRYLEGTGVKRIVCHPQLKTTFARAAKRYRVATKGIDGVRVQLTTPAKTVADCFRFRRHVGLEVAIAALRDYLRKRKGSVDALVEAARADRIDPFVRRYLEALA